MNTAAYSGIWLHPGTGRGEQFTHSEADYDHPEGGDGTIPMRHVVLERSGEKTGLRVPASWTDEQAREALESDW